MKCESAHPDLVLLAYGELPDEKIHPLEEHLAICEACRSELSAITGLQAVMAHHAMTEPSPNLLAQSRLRLDEALDNMPHPTVLERLRSLFVGSLRHVQAAPALATLLVGAGFLGGTFVNNYRIAHQPKMPTPVFMTNTANSAIANVSSIVQTPNSSIVQVNYNRVVPETAQGSLDDPQIRQLLMAGAKNGINNNVRASSVGLLADECRAGHRCEGGDNGEGVRDALLVSLRSDTNRSVRLKALDGLQPYLASDQRVRDAVLDAIMHDRDPDVRIQAISMLDPVEGDSSVRQVLHTVSTTDENPYIRNASTHALESAGQIQ